MRKKPAWILIIVLACWGLIMTIDYRRICHGFEKPIFATPKTTVDDGGSGEYKGLGYTFDIKGNFMPEDVLSGVTHADFYLLGRHAKEAIRD